jgi:hypothetical protein
MVWVRIFNFFFFLLLSLFFFVWGYVLFSRCSCDVLFDSVVASVFTFLSPSLYFYFAFSSSLLCVCLQVPDLLSVFLIYRCLIITLPAPPSLTRLHFILSRFTKQKKKLAHYSCYACVSRNHLHIHLFR